MSAIAGLMRAEGGTRLQSDLRAMLAELRDYGPHDEASRVLGEVGFGRTLFATLPEDDHDRQPLVGGGGRWLLVADVRIDNRDEAAAALGIARPELARSSDADLLLRCWERWQLRCFEHLLGDIALGVWDGELRQLTIARGPNSLKPLCYHVGPKVIAFATMPQALHAIAGIDKDIHLEEAAAVAAGYANQSSATIFAGIRQVSHGEAIIVRSGGETIVRLWDPHSIEPSSMSLADSAEMIRAELDRATRARLRRRSGAVACHLSSGRDSSAVAASAAMILAADGSDRLLALTGAPNADFAGPVIPGRLADESPLAALIARAHPNIDHAICRSRPAPPGLLLRQLTERHYRPITNPSALHWGWEVDSTARERGASVLLMGAAGNLSISASGLPHLVDVLANEGPLHWWRHARRFGGSDLGTWRTIANVSLGPFLPRSLYSAILRASGRDPYAGYDLPLLRAPYRQQAEALHRRMLRDIRPPRAYRRFRQSLLLRRDGAEKMSLSLFGLDVRDPTGDRRLVERCLTIPAAHLASAGPAPSPAYARAFAGRLPDAVVHNRRRGYQGADWFQLFSRNSLAEAFSRYRRNRLIAELLDLDCVDRLIATWPEAGSCAWSDIDLYRNQLLAALSVSDFIDLHFPDV